MRKTSPNPNEGNFGFQIAPMIDVVFVIMLFFMVMAGSVKVEKEIVTQLPGQPKENPGETPLVDDLIIAISDEGRVTLNDEEFDAPASRDLPQLKTTLLRLKQADDASKSPTEVTVVSDPAAKYSRTMDVLDALAVAKISNVTFTLSQPE